MTRHGLLFVCLGNICRSPLAKFVMLDLVETRGLSHAFDIDSCGTGAWHAGDDADPRTVEVARRHGLNTEHVARPMRPAVDFDRFGLLLAMDLDNQRNLLRAGAPEAKVKLLRSFDPALAGQPEHALQVPDPYYGGPEGFERMHEMIAAACLGLLDTLVRDAHP